MRRPKDIVRVVVVLSVLSTLAIFVVSILLPWCCERGGQDGALTETEMQNIERIDKQIKCAKEARKEKDSQVHLSASLRPFDPNHADSLTLLSLGLSKWQVKNMLAYRRKGGRWRSPDDLRRLYGLTEEEFKRLRPYVRIAEADRRSKFVPFPRKEDYGVPMAERVDYERVEKLTEGTNISLNMADTTLLKKIPGIGSYNARKIVKYRESMGGFVSVRQIEEIEGLPAGLSRWFENDSHETKVRKLRINKASFKELVRHPYLDYEQTKAIVNHIRKYGPIRSWQELRLYKEFSDKDFERLTPYVDFK